MPRFPDASSSPSNADSAPNRFAKAASPKVLAVFRRVMFSIAVVVAVFWGFYYAIDPGYYDPLWLRGVLIAGGVVPALLTYGRSWSLRAVAWTGAVYSLAMSAVVTWLGVRNGLDGPWALGICAGFVGSGLAVALYAPTARVLRVLLAVFAGVNAAAALVAWTPEAQVGIFLGYLVAYTGAFYMAGASRIAIFRRYRESRDATRESERLLQALIDAIPDAIYVLDAERQFLAFNRSATHTFGHSADEAVGKTPEDLFPAHHAENLKRWDREAIASPKEPHHAEYDFVMPDGRELRVEATRVVIHDEDEAVRRLLCIARDVTEQKEAEEALRAAKEAAEGREREITEQKQLLQTLFDTIPDVLFVLNREGQFILRNPAAIRTQGGGGTADEGRHDLFAPGVADAPFAEAQTHHDLFPPEVADALRAEDLRLMESGERLVDVEYPFTTPDGEERMWSGTKVPIRASDGAVTGLVCITHDITEQKRAEAELVEAKEAAEAREREVKQHEALLHTIIDTIPDVLFVLNREGRFILRNATAVQTHGGIGGTADEGHHDLFAPEVADALLAEDLRLMEAGESVSDLEYPLTAPDGQEHVWSAKKVPLRTADGTVTGLVGIIRDVTEEKASEAELVAAKEAAEAATKAKSEFLANMSHEIRTPMNGVIGMTSLLLDTDLDAEQRDFVETVRASGDTLLTLINDILDFSKIEAGRLELETHPFDVRECVEDVLDLVATRAADKGVELAYLIEEGTPSTILGDATRVRQVLVNLVGNAVKFTEEGSVCVRVAAEPADVGPPGRCAVHFTVEDTGVGIPANKLASIFESFSQADASTTRKHGGTGLGLAISKRLIALMGGEISVESEEGRGSTFRFWVDAEVAPSSRRVFLRKNPPALAGRRVLIVDDNGVNRKILRRFTERWGMDAVLASSGKEALQAAAEETFDLVLLDMQMPEMDGLEVAEALAEAETPPAVVILSSVNREAQFRERAAALGVATALYKPIKPARLYEALLGVFEDQPVRAEAQGGAKAPEELDAVPDTNEDGLHILLAEDNVVNQKVALRMLDRLGHCADVAANGVEVLQALGRQRYDVVLMDVQMPEMDGLEATRAIRASDRSAQPFVIALTANAMPGDRDRCFAAGVDAYLTKPVSVADLGEALSEVSEQSEMSLSDERDEFPPSHQPVAAAASTVREALLEHIGDDDPEFLLELAGSYLASTGRLMARARAGLADGTLDEVSRAAHTLKSSSAMLGLDRLAELCETLETDARTGDTEAAESGFAEVARASERARAVVEAVQARAQSRLEPDRHAELR